MILGKGFHKAQGAEGSLLSGLKKLGFLVESKHLGLQDSMGLGNVQDDDSLKNVVLLFHQRLLHKSGQMVEAFDGSAAEQLQL